MEGGGFRAGPALGRGAARGREGRPTAPGLLLLCPSAAALAVVAWNGRQGLAGLALLLALPLLVGRAGSRGGAMLVAFAYYAAAARAVPGILQGFFPGLSELTCLALWAGHAALLALPWTLVHGAPGAPAWRRGVGAAAALALLSLPPLGLFHWASPLMAAGLLFPGWRWLGLLLTLALMALLAAGDFGARRVQGALLGAAVLALGANVAYRAPAPPPDWRAVSLALGRSPELWSEQMEQRRLLLVRRALRELEEGARVVVFPESVAGSDRRDQAALWLPVARAAQARGATVLVGEEHWGRGRQGFRNALVGYGAAGGNGALLVSSRVPMPMGDWKFGLEEGAATDVFGDDVLVLHGRRVAFSMCYEDFLFWTHRGLLAGRAELLVSATNQWPSAGTSAEVGQDLSRMALARLAGVALLTAKNH